MNSKRRKQVKEAIAQIESLVQNILDDEIEAYDNMPDGIRCSQNGISSEESQELLESAIEALEEAACCLEEI